MIPRGLPYDELEIDPIARSYRDHMLTLGKDKFLSKPLDQLLAARRRLPLTLLGERARALAEQLLAVPEVRRAATVSAYSVSPPSGGHSMP